MDAASHPWWAFATAPVTPRSTDRARCWPHTYFPARTPASPLQNAYVFPGIGLGCVLSQPRRITERMFAAAARALADMVTEEQLAEGMVLPPITEIRAVSARVAAAVAASGIADGIVQRMPPAGDLVEFMAAAMYDPRYVPIVNPSDAA